MPRKQPPAATPKGPTNLAVSRPEAQAKLLDRIDRGKAILAREIRNLSELATARDDHSKWSSFNYELLKRLFTTDEPAEEYARFYGGMIRMNPSPQEQLESFHEDVSNGIRRLESILERLELYQEPLGTHAGPSTSAKDDRKKNRVFIVHGHDDGARETVARLLERLHLDAIVLHEQASGGKTIIEKLEHFSDVDFAVVLLTPDDVGAAKADTGNLRPRARQNVVLELGLFIGLLTRKHVCALYKGNVELPSDFGGVVYVPMDDGGAWKFLLGRELTAAGFDVDLNRIA